jgi:hypothetical protein
LKLPTGVRAAAAMTISVMAIPLLDGAQLAADAYM